MLAQVVLFDGFDPLDAVAPCEVLAAGGLFTGGALDVELVSAEGAREVPSGLGLSSMRATARLEPARADLLVVPGAAGRMPVEGEALDDGITAIMGRALETDLPGLFKEALDRPGLTVSTVCGGSMLLAMAGLLAGRRATTHHSGLEALGSAGATAIRARVVDDGDLVTGAGVTSGLDLGMYLLERELGPRVALAVEEFFAHERRGTVWRGIGAEPAAGV